MHKTLTFFSLALTLFVATLVLALCLRGLPGKPTEGELQTSYWKERGPFELSPERGRFTLTYSLLENHSFSFSPSLAAFVAPDVAIHNGLFVSLFPPGLSYFIIPGYLLGRVFGHTQVGTTAVISLFALLNLFTIVSLARRLGAHPSAAVIAGLTFLFASPAFSYGVTLYQHHITTSLLLLSIWILVVVKSNWWLTLVWFMAGVAIVVDTPNAIFFIPICVFGFTRFFTRQETLHTYVFRARPWQFFTLLAGVLPILFLMFFNQQSYGNLWQLGGTAIRVTEVTLSVDPVTQATIAIPTKKETATLKEKTTIAFFKTRLMTHGVYTHFFARDRGMLFFTPVMFLSLFGIGGLMRRRPRVVALLLATIGTIVLLYSMWGDPYGGWAFGSRYLIPVYALLSIFLAETLTRFRKNLFLILLFVVLATYSIGVNTTGALTTSANPPRVELKALEEQNNPVKVGYLNNVAILQANRSKSFLFQMFAQQGMTTYWYAGGIIAMLLVLLYGHLLWLLLSPMLNKTPENSL